MATEQHNSSELPPIANLTTQEIVDLAISRAVQSIALLRAAAQKESTAFTQRAQELGLDPITIVGCIDPELTNHSSKEAQYNRSAELMKQAAIFARKSSTRRIRRGRTRFLD